MALTRTNDFENGTPLTQEELEGEFDAIYSGGTDLAFPLTKSVSAGGFRIDDFSKGSLSTPGINFTGDSNTGIHSSAADVLELAAGGNEVLQLTGGTSDVTYVDIDSGATGTPPIIRAEGEAATGLDIAATGAANIRLQANSTTMLTVTSSTSVDLGANIPLVPAAVSGTPILHALHRENVVKGWIVAQVTGGTPANNNSYNVTSITDSAQGQLTVTWDRDFADTNYVVLVTGEAGGVSRAYSVEGTPAAGSVQVMCTNFSGPSDEDPAIWYVFAIGDQA